MNVSEMGGPVSELVLTCRTEDSGEPEIAKGDPLQLTGSYTVARTTESGGPLFGQALRGATGPGKRVPVLVKGVCVFKYTGAAPVVDGDSGVTGSDEPGMVEAPALGAGTGLAIAVDEAAGTVHVLL